MSIKNYAVVSTILVSSLFVTSNAFAADSSVSTGDTESNVTITNEAGSNWLNLGGGQGSNTHVELSDNGAFSDNKASVYTQNNTYVNQTNNTTVNNHVRVNSNTGDNTTSSTRRGDSEINTGDTNTNVTIETTAGKNVLNLNCATCNGSTDVEVSDNGAFSDNEVTVRNTNDQRINQTNNTNVRNNVEVNSNTGNNDVFGGSSHNYDYDKNKSWSGNDHMDTENSHYWPDRKSYAENSYRDNKPEINHDYNYDHKKNNHDDKKYDHEYDKDNHDYDWEYDKKDKKEYDWNKDYTPHVYVQGIDYNQDHGKKYNDGYKDYEKRFHDNYKDKDHDRYLNTRYISDLVYLCQKHGHMYFDYHELSCKPEKKYFSYNDHKHTTYKPVKYVKVDYRDHDYDKKVNYDHKKYWDWSDKSYNDHKNTKYKPVKYVTVEYRDHDYKKYDMKKKHYDYDWDNKKSDYKFSQHHNNKDGKYKPYRLFVKKYDIDHHSYGKKYSKDTYKKYYHPTLFVKAPIHKISCYQEPKFKIGKNNNWMKDNRSKSFQYSRGYTVLQS